MDPLALTRFALLHGVIGSLCLTVTVFLIVLLVEPVSGSALIWHVVPCNFSHKFTLGVGPQP